MVSVQKFEKSVLAKFAQPRVAVRTVANFFSRLLLSIVLFLAEICRDGFYICTLSKCVFPSAFIPSIEMETIMEMHNDKNIDNNIGNGNNLLPYENLQTLKLFPQNLSPPLNQKYVRKFF